MILLDTNVLSELVRPMPAPAVFAWANSIAAGEACTTAITEAEMRFGIERLPHKRRRTLLTQAAIVRARNVQAIATRNTRDFADCGLLLINPWQPPSPRRHA